MIQLSVPSKTFLLGEYVVLKGGPAILLATAPSFRMKVSPSQGDSPMALHPLSPAGKWLEKWKIFYSAYNMEFIDPHTGLNGFGSSSAQFLMLYGLMHGRRIDEWKMLQEYKACAPGSGADLMAQLKGGVCFFHPSIKQAESQAWPFPDLEYGIIRTGYKLATHHHLQNLSNFDVAPLDSIAKEAYESIATEDSARFLEAMQRYGYELKIQGLLFHETEKILDRIKRCKEIKAAKGCGALGADVILILYYRQAREQVLSWINQEKLQLVAHGQETAQGLKLWKN